MDAACNAEKDYINGGDISQPAPANSVQKQENMESTFQDTKIIAEEALANDISSSGSSHKEIFAREIAVQTNDSDIEIERNIGKLPIRKRYIPLKFSDYRIFAGEEGKNLKEDEEDVSFEPEKRLIPNKVKKTSCKRGRGRPRKNPPPQDEQELPVTENLSEVSKVRNQVSKVSSGFKCGICGRIFSLKGNAKAHMITHTDERPFHCDFEGCSKKLRTKESLRRHQLSHMDIKMFECPECKKRFSCNASLQEHMARHTGEKPLSCDICGRRFRQVAVLKRHLTTHSDKKPFACVVCGKQFAMKIYVQSHMKTHTGERPFSCDVCNKAFAHASDLNRHKIIHSGEKPYKCSVCPMSYSDPSSRRRHEREHQTKQQCACHLCNQQFTRASLLRLHMLAVHGSDPQNMSFEVQVMEKPPAGGWPANESEPKVMNVLQNLPPGLAVQQVEVQVQDGPDGKANSETSADSAVQFLVETTEMACNEKETETKVSSLNGDSKHIALSEIPELVNLQHGCTYKIVGSTDGSQVIELQLDEGVNGIPITDLADKVNLAGLQMSDAPLTFIQHDDTFTVFRVPQEISVQISKDTETSQKSLNYSEQSEDCFFPSDNVDNVKTDMSSCHLASYADSASSAALDHSANVSNVSDSKGEVALSDLIKVEVSETPSTMPDLLPSLCDSGYVYQPDLNSQEYYNWLSAFTEECKVLSMPLENTKFKKISHVQKTLSDFMASPSGVISDRNNFKVLMTITKELADIISTHLSYMYQNLSYS